MAKGLFQKLLLEEEINNIEVLSAGTNVWFEEGASSNAISTALEFGVDIKNHRTTRLSSELINKADLILTMGVSHKLKILSINSGLNKKIFTLKEFAGSNENDLDIKDPFGMGQEEYKKCANEICEYLVKAKEKIKGMWGNDNE